MVWIEIEHYRKTIIIFCSAKVCCVLNILVFVGHLQIVIINNISKKFHPIEYIRIT